MILVIIQARMSSRRLPGKVLKSILGEPMLLRQIERIKRSKRLDQLLVATSDEASDDPIAQCCEEHKIICFRGSLDDVLDRYYQAAKLHNADHIVRITGDCPLIDSVLIDQVIETHLKEKNDYTANIIKPTYPDGLDIEVLTFSCLEKAWLTASEAFHREHVTAYIRRHAEQFSIGSVVSEVDNSSLRWTVDEAVDFKLVSEIYTRLYPDNPNFTSEDILRLLQKNPDLLSLNVELKRRLSHLEKGVIENEI